MVKNISGELIVSGQRFVLLASRFNEFITSHLIEGAKDCLLRHGAKEDDITVTWVPGPGRYPRSVPSWPAGALARLSSASAR